MVGDNSNKLSDGKFLEWTSHSVWNNVVTGKCVVAQSSKAVDTLDYHVELDRHAICKLHLIHYEVELAVDNLVIDFDVLLSVERAVILVDGEGAYIALALYGIWG